MRIKMIDCINENNIQFYQSFFALPSLSFLSQKNIAIQVYRENIEYDDSQIGQLDDLNNFVFNDNYNFDPNLNYNDDAKKTEKVNSYFQWISGKKEFLSYKQMSFLMQHSPVESVSFNHSRVSNILHRDFVIPNTIAINGRSYDNIAQRRFMKYHLVDNNILIDTKTTTYLFIADNNVDNVYYCQASEQSNETTQHCDEVADTPITKINSDEIQNKKLHPLMESRYILHLTKDGELKLAGKEDVRLIDEKAQAYSLKLNEKFAEIVLWPQYIKPRQLMSLCIIYAMVGFTLGMISVHLFAGLSVLPILYLLLPEKTKQDLKIEPYFRNKYVQSIQFDTQEKLSKHMIIDAKEEYRRQSHEELDTEQTDSRDQFGRT